MGRSRSHVGLRSVAVALVALTGGIGAWLTAPSIAGATSGGPVLDSSLATPVITSPTSGAVETTPTVTIGGTASATAAVVVTVTGNWIALAKSGPTATGAWSVPITLLQRATDYTVTAREITTTNQEGPLSASVTLSVSSNNLVKNGLFHLADQSRLAGGDLVTVDTGTTTQLPDWTVFTPPNYSGLGSIDVNSYLYWNSVEDNATDNSIDLAGSTSAPGGLSQDVATTPGLQYTLVFWSAVNGDEPQGVTHTFTVSVNGTQIADLHQPSAGRPVQWVKRTYQITATGTTTHLSFADITPGDTDQGPTVDDVSMVPSYSLAPSNTSWQTALTLSSAPPAPNRQLTFSGEELWYKFPIVPGENATVSLSNVAANFQVSLFSDITTLYKAQTTPATTLTLAELEAQDPENSQAAEFYHGEFYHGEFYHGTFDDGEFYHGEFYNGEFYHGEFYHGEFYHGEFYNGEFYHGSGTAPDEEALAGSYLGSSTQQGAVDKSVSGSSFTDAGYFYAEVSGIDGVDASTPFTVSVAKTGDACGSASITTLRSTDGYSVETGPGTVSGAGGPYPTTVIVDNSSSMPQVSPTYDATTDSATGGTGAGGISSTLTKLANTTGGAIVDVGKSKWVQTQSAQAGANAGCSYDVNLEADAIQSIINTYRNPAAAGSLKYVVIVGDDDVVPFFRYPDMEQIQTETHFTTALLKSTTEAAAAIANDYYLTDDQYGATANLTISGSTIPIQTAAVGRLVETPANISKTINDFLTKGTIDPTSTLSAGYTFMAPPAQEIATTFSAEGVSPATNQQLITPETVSPTTVGAPPTGSWKATTLSSDLTKKTHQLVFLGAHFNANALLSAHKHTTTLTTSTFAGEIGTNLNDSLVLSAGCHAGYTITPQDTLTVPTRGLAWPQAFNAAGATLIAGTGYQYGDGNYVAASDQVYVDLAQQLGYRPAQGSAQPVGSALLSTEWRYLAGLDQINGLQEKALLQVTLFGLPMLGVKMPTQTTAPGATHSLVNDAGGVTSGPGKSLTLEQATVTVPATYTKKVTTASEAATLGYHVGPQGEVADPGGPVVPLQIDDVNVQGQTLRGVGFWGGTYTDTTAGGLPLTGDPVVQTQSLTPPPFSSPDFYPSKITNPNYFGAIDTGSDTDLGITPVQYETNPATSGKAIMRAYKTIDLRLFYSSNKTSYGKDIPALATAPTIVSPSVTVSGDQVTVTATVLGDPTAGTQEVWTTFTDPSTGSSSWTSKDLTQSLTDPDRWSETFVDPSGTSSVFMLQATNGVGEVTLDNNGGAFYTPTVVQESLVKTNIAVTTVTGSQTYGSTSPVFTGTYTAPTGVTVIGTITCTDVSAGTRAVNSTLPAGTYTVKATTCKGLSTATGGYTFTYSARGSGFVVSKATIAVTTVTGSQTYGSTSPVFTGTYTKPPGTTVTGAIACAKVTSGTTISKTLAPGTYTAKATTCSGLTATTNNYSLTYAAKGSGFVVTALHAVPTITSLSRTSGPVSGGTQVTITGTGFSTISNIKFGTTLAKSYTVRSATQIMAASPVHAAGTVRISVTTAGGTTPATRADLYKYVVPAPVVSAITPASGPAAGGTTVTVSGSGFTGATTVFFGSNKAKTVSVNAGGTQLTVKSPAGASGAAVNVQVKTPVGESPAVTADLFTYGPTITGLSRTSGPVSGGTKVTITGAGFSTTTSVKFATSPAETFTVKSATQISATSPAHAAGQVRVSVTTPDGTTPATGSDLYTY